MFLSLEKRPEGAGTPTPEDGMLLVDAGTTRVTQRGLLHECSKKCKLNSTAATQGNEKALSR